MCLHHGASRVRHSVGDGRLLAYEKSVHVVAEGVVPPLEVAGVDLDVLRGDLVRHLCCLLAGAAHDDFPAVPHAVPAASRVCSGSIACGIKSSTFWPRSSDVVTRTVGESGPCSACLAESKPRSIGPRFRQRGSEARCVRRGRRSPPDRRGGVWLRPASGWRSKATSGMRDRSLAAAAPGGPTRA